MAIRAISTVAIALLAIIAVGFAVVARFDFIPGEQFGVGYRLDRWTGSVEVCVAETSSDVDKLKKFRAQYPQYSEVEEGVLLKAVHENFYSDMKYDDFVRAAQAPVNLDPMKIKGETQRMTCR